MHSQVALGVRSQSVFAHARNLHFTSPEGEGFQPSPKETLSPDSATKRVFYTRPKFTGFCHSGKPESGFYIFATAAAGGRPSGRINGYFPPEAVVCRRD